MLHYQIKEASKKQGWLTLVLLHAFPFSSDMWENERKVFSGYAKVLTPDLPGFGGSPRLDEVSIANMAEEVRHLLDHLKIEEPVVIGGLSMGGYVALEFYNRYPGRVRGLMLFATRAGADSRETRETRFKTIREIEQNGLDAFAEKTVFKMVGKTTAVLKPGTVQGIKQSMLASKEQGVTDALRAMAERADLTDLLGAVMCPTLILAGEEDGIIPPEEAAAMENKIPMAEMYRIPRVGHLINLENPEMFTALVESFLMTAIYKYSKQEMTHKSF